MEIGIGLSISGVRSALASYDPAASALFARMSAQPDATRKALINAAILSLKTAGVWSLLDCFYMMAAADAQSSLLNWKSTSFNLLAVNAPAFTADRGYAGDGTTSYLNTQFNPATAAGQYARDSASLGVYNRTSRAAGNTLSAAGNGNALVYPRQGGDICNTRINDAGAGVSNANSNGLIVGSRVASTDRTTYRNGASIGNVVTASLAMTSQPIYLCGFNNAGTFAQGSTDQFASALIGAGLDATQNAALYAATQAYMTGVGANV